jgi:hypothetical protein
MNNLRKLSEEVLKESRTVREMSKEEEQNVMQSMSDNFDIQDDPEVGIFWYDEKNDELFGVNKANINDLQFNGNGLKTISILHKTWWQKQKHRLISKGKDPGIFIKDYTLIPRGRIFQKIDNTFQLMCGSWMNDHIENLIKDEFNLQNVPFEKIVNTHWEIGHGWSEEY